MANVRERDTAGTVARPEIAFVLPLSDDAHNFITELEVEILRRYGVNDALVASPHVTLKLGFMTAELAPYAAYLDEVARTTPPLEIILRGIRSFEEGVIFIDVVPTPALQELRLRIVSDLAQRFDVAPKPFEGDAFHFHVTVAHGLPRAAFDTELLRLTPLNPTFHFQARTIAMLCHAGDHWITYRRATLR